MYEFICHICRYRRNNPNEKATTKVEEQSPCSFGSLLVDRASGKSVYEFSRGPNCWAFRGALFFLSAGAGIFWSRGICISVSPSSAGIASSWLPVSGTVLFVLSLGLFFDSRCACLVGSVGVVCGCDGPA